MKAFAVVNYDASVNRDMRIPGYNGDNRHAFYPIQNEAVGEGLDRHLLVYYCDDEPSADALASRLAAIHPGRSYSVVKTSKVYQCPAGPVAVSRWTDRGLVPA